MRRSLSFVVVMVGIFAGCAAPARPCPSAPVAAQNGARTVTLFFPERGDPHQDCQAHVAAPRVVPAGAEPLAFAIDALLHGPTADEAARGAASPFDRSVSRPETPPLRTIAVRVDGAIVTVDLAERDAPYLLQAICARTAVADAIERTVIGVTGAREVRWAIAGQVIEEWDA